MVENSDLWLNSVQQCWTVSVELHHPPPVTMFYGQHYPWSQWGMYAKLWLNGIIRRCDYTVYNTHLICGNYITKLDNLEKWTAVALQWENYTNYRYPTTYWLRNVVCTVRASSLACIVVSVTLSAEQCVCVPRVNCLSSRWRNGNIYKMFPLLDF